MTALGKNSSNSVNNLVFSLSPWSGDLPLDLPLPRLPAGTLTRRLPLPRAPQVHQLLRQGVRLHAAALHAVPRRLGAVQDPPAPRQDKVLQVYLVLVGGRGGAEVTRVAGLDWRTDGCRIKARGVGRPQNVLGPGFESLRVYLLELKVRGGHCQNKISLFNRRHAPSPLPPPPPHSCSLLTLDRQPLQMSFGLLRKQVGGAAALQTADGAAVPSIMDLLGLLTVDWKSREWRRRAARKLVC